MPKDIDRSTSGACRGQLRVRGLSVARHEFVPHYARGPGLHGGGREVAGMAPTPPSLSSSIPTLRSTVESWWPGCRPGGSKRCGKVPHADSGVSSAGSRPCGLQQVPGPR